MDFIRTDLTESDVARGRAPKLQTATNQILLAGVGYTSPICRITSSFGKQMHFTFFIS